MKPFPSRPVFYAFVCELLIAAVFFGFGPAGSRALPANLLTNGTFDTDLAGWTLSAQTYRTCVGTSPIRSVIAGRSAAWLNACGGAVDKPQISQTLAVTAGATYVVSGVIRQGSLVLSPPNVFAQFDVIVDGVSVPTTFGTRDTDGWAEFTGTFEASSASIVLVFRAETTIDIDYYVDSLSLVPGSPPTTVPPTTVSPPTTVDTSLPSTTINVGLASPSSTTRTRESSGASAQSEDLPKSGGSLFPAVVGLVLALGGTAIVVRARRSDVTTD